MRLAGPDASVELRIVGYESELDAGDVRTVEDWLVVRAVVTVGAERREYDGISMDIEEATEFGAWLDSVATARTAADIDPSTPFFVEPDLTVELIRFDADGVVVRWHVHDPDGPPTAVRDLRMNARTVDTVTRREQFAAAGRAWEYALRAVTGT